MKRSNFYSILYISLTVLILILVGSTLNIAKAEDSLALIPERPSNENWYLIYSAVSISL